MPLQPIETRRLYRQIADQVAGLIARGEFPPGARLPTERELAQLLGVSRPSVREGLIALEVEGLVDVRVGSGIYVRRARKIGKMIRRRLTALSANDRLARESRCALPFGFAGT